MAPRKIYNFAIDQDLADGLKEYKRESGMPESEAIRRALRAFLESKGVIKSERSRAATQKRS